MAYKRKFGFWDWIIIYLLIPYGLFYIFFSHSIHQIYSLDWLFGWNFPHVVHIFLGVVLLFFGLRKLVKQYGKK